MCAKTVWFRQRKSSVCRGNETLVSENRHTPISKDNDSMQVVDRLLWINAIRHDLMANRITSVQFLLTENRGCQLS